MFARRDAVAHSPTLWALYGAVTAAAAITTLTIAWNAWEHRHDLPGWIADLARL